MLYAAVALCLAAFLPTVHGACVVGSIDLSAIPNALLSISQEIVPTGDLSDHQWYISLCTPVRPASLPLCNENGAGYVTEYGGDLSGCETSWETIQTSYAMSGSNVVVTFGELATSNHATWTMKVTISCGSTVALQSTGNVLATQVGFNTYAFEMSLTSSVICGGPPPPPPPPPPPTPPGPPGPTPPTPPSNVTPSGCGGGCVFVILFFVGGFVYVVGTVLFYYFKQDKRGKELLPHPEFWGSLPGLVKDGVMFIVTKIRGCCGGGAAASGSYANV